MLRTAFCGMMRTAQRRLARARTCGVRCNAVQQVATSTQQVATPAEQVATPCNSSQRRNGTPSAAQQRMARAPACGVRCNGCCRSCRTCQTSRTRACPTRCTQRAPMPHTRPPARERYSIMCGSPLPFHICTGIRLTCATSAPGLGSPLPHLHRVLHAARLHCACNMHASS